MKRWLPIRTTGRLWWSKAISGPTPPHSTVLEVLGPQYARLSENVYIDESVLVTGTVEQNKQEENLSRLRE